MTPSFPPVCRHRGEAIGLAARICPNKSEMSPTEPSTSTECALQGRPQAMITALGGTFG